VKLDFTDISILLFLRTYGVHMYQKNVVYVGELQILGKITLWKTKSRPRQFVSCTFYYIILYGEKFPILCCVLFEGWFT
jgi:hypothetical protein